MTNALAVAKVLTLAQALATAQAQPQVRQAAANTLAAEARTDEARALLLPALVGTAIYQRKTGNFAPQPGAVPSLINMNRMGSNFDTSNFFNFGLALSTLVYDFGFTWNRWKAAGAVAESQAATERAVKLTVDAQVRTAFFGARAQKALVEVAKETLVNQDRHLAQIEGFVRIGTRPEIDLAQARTDRANAQVSLITTDNGYLVAKAQLNQAMGVEASTDYDVADDTLGPLPDEDAPTEQLVEEAVRARPEMAAFDRQIRAQQLTLRAVKGGYFPSLNAGMALTDAGTELDALAWNWSFTLSVNWAIFSGLQTWSTVKEAKATLDSLEAQRDQERLSVRLEVEQARLTLRAAKAAVGAAEEALVNARERLRLAEGRYEAGVGSVIELGDAQVALTNAAAQRVQADYSVATARAQMMKALGRR
jgi:outer membrane protein